MSRVEPLPNTNVGRGAGQPACDLSLALTPLILAMTSRNLLHAKGITLDIHSAVRTQSTSSKTSECPRTQAAQKVPSMSTHAFTVMVR